MRSYHLHENTTATPEQLLAAITDFGPGRQEVFGNSAAKFLRVQDLGADTLTSPRAPAVTTRQSVGSASPTRASSSRMSAAVVETSPPTDEVSTIHV